MKLLTKLVTAMAFTSSNSFLNNNTYRGLSKLVYMKKDSADFKNMYPVYQPKSENQKKYAKYLSDEKTRIVFSVGPAGTGKTLFACNQAINDLKSGTINKIILTRPVVPVEEDIGFLPGNINKKMDPWTRPIFDIFSEFYTQRDIDLMLHNGVIEISPLAYMRGRTFKKAFIIADEMQNSSPNQMLMLTTRIGQGSKMVITGDLKQSDKGIYSGLHDFLKKFSLYEKLICKKRDFEESNNEKFDYNKHNIGIKIVEFEFGDVERSPVVSRILEIYDEEKINRELNDMESSSLEKISKQELPQPQNKVENIADNDSALIPLRHFSRLKE